MSIRPVKKILKAQPTIEGAGVSLRRAIGFGDPAEVDPFLLLDDFLMITWQVFRGILIVELKL